MRRGMKCSTVGDPRSTPAGQEVDDTPLTRAQEDADGARRSASGLHPTHARA
jgi:hypothetical protein